MGSIRKLSSQPPVQPEQLDAFEEYYELRLPCSYRQLLLSFNGAEVIDGEISAGGRTWAVGPFLCLLKEPRHHAAGASDIEVVMSEFDERLGPEDEVAPSLVPIAALSFGDLACLDYRTSRTDPAVVVWDNVQSEEFDPFTIPLASSFDEFVAQLLGGKVAQPGGDSTG